MRGKAAQPPGRDGRGAELLALANTPAPTPTSVFLAIPPNEKNKKSKRKALLDLPEGGFGAAVAPGIPGIARGSAIPHERT